MEKEKQINISKVLISVISALILVIIIAVLTKILTSKKQAAEVTPENVQTNVASQENTWKATNNENAQEVTNTQSVEEPNNEVANTQNVEEPNKEVANTQNVESPNNEVTNAQNVENTNNNTTTQNTVSTNNSQTTDKKKSNEGVIWLTFDDGPSANITPKILDILKKENVKATFFVINYSDSNEHLLKRAVEEGHTIGIHGYSHEYSKIYKSKETFLDNVYKLQERIEKSTGVKSMYIRFPGGSSNTVSRKYCKGIMTELTKEMLAKGFKYYDWNISSGDAGGAKTAKDVYKNVTKNLSKKRGNMVLMHDFGGNKKGLEALPDIIKYAKKQGYTFAAIDDDTPMYAQHVNN